MNGNDILGITMAGLEAGFKVADIAAFPVETRDAHAKASKVLAEESLAEFDCIPVREGDRIIGALERRSNHIQGTAKDCMRPLDDSMLVSAQEPLISFLSVFGNSPYRLVVKGTEVRGIVTHSDVTKLPVRLMAFTLVTHLEIVMAQVIRKECPNASQWMNLLYSKQRKRVEDLYKQREDENIHLTMKLDVTSFGHKMTMITTLQDLDEHLTDQLAQVKKLRDSLDHARDFVDDAGGVRGFLDRFRLAEEWIQTLSKPQEIGNITATEGNSIP